MTNNQFNTWKDKMITWAESPAGREGDKNIDCFINATDSQSSTVEDRIVKVTSAEESLILIANDQKKITFLHSIKNLGGKLFRPDDKVVALSGLTHEAKAVILNSDTAFDALEIKAAKYQDILTCEKENVPNLPPVATRNQQLKGCGMVIPPPHMIRAILGEASIGEDGTVDPFELIDLVLKEAKRFDNETGENEAYRCLSEQWSEQLVRFLWAVGKGLVEPIDMEFATNDEEISAFSEKLHENFILPPVGDARRVMFVENQLDLLKSQAVQTTSAINRISEALETQNEISAKIADQNEVKMAQSKDRSNKYHDSLFVMLRNAASIDGIKPADEVPESIMRIFNADSKSKAEQELTNQFEALGHEVSFAEGLIGALYEGKVNWPNDETPHNFASPFTVWKTRANDTSMHDRYLFLKMRETMGKDMSDEDIKKVLKQSIRVPETHYELLKQAEVFHASIQIMTGKDSLVQSRWKKQFIEGIKKLESRIEAEAIRDKEFCSGALYSAGLKYFHFLRDCRAPDMKGVSGSVINFEGLIERIRDQEFTPRLPITFKTKTDSKRKAQDEPEDTEDTSGNGGGGGNPRGGKRTKTKASVERNEDPVDGWLLKDLKKWPQFSGAENSKGRPLWDEKTPICHKYHIKGVCYSDCPNKASHVGKGDIPDAKKKEFKAWIDSRAN